MPEPKKRGRPKKPSPPPAPVEEVAGLPVVAAPKFSKKISQMTPEERAIALKNLTRPNKRLEIEDLPTWVRLAISKHELTGKTWKQCAKEADKAYGNLKMFKSSPAAKKYAALLKEQTNDPVEMARKVWEAQANNIALENLLIMEAAKKAGNVAEMGKQARFLAESIGLPKPKKEDAAPTSITINLPGGSTITTEIPLGDSSSERVVDAEIIDE